MNYVPIIIFVLVIAGLVAFSGRARRRQASVQQAMSDRIGVGSDVMTTSGLHGTVVARNDDDTVQLSIAPGVEVRWELAALRERSSLPQSVRSAARGQTKPDESPARIDLEKGEPSRGVDPA